MPSPSFTLDAQLRFHDKWLKIDLQVCNKMLYYYIDHFHTHLLPQSWLFFASQNCVVEFHHIISQVVVGRVCYWGPN